MNLVSDIRFACPHCSQHLACAKGYSGHYVQCPNCQRTLVIPRPLPPPPPTQTGSKTRSTKSTFDSQFFDSQIRDSFLHLLNLLISAVILVGTPLMTVLAQKHPNHWFTSALLKVGTIGVFLAPILASLLIAGFPIRISVWRALLFIALCPVLYLVEFFIWVFVAFLTN